MFAKNYAFRWKTFFFQSAHLFALRREYGVLVYTRHNKIKGMSEVTDFCHNGPRSTRVQAAFVKAMCGVLCAASQ